jgi:hypothetical protein
MQALMMKNVSCGLSSQSIFVSVPGRVFATRLCFGAAGIEYENKYLTFPDLVAARGLHDPKG